MKTKYYIFNMKDGRKIEHELTEKQRNVFILENGYLNCDDCASCKFNNNSVADDSNLCRFVNIHVVSIIEKDRVMGVREKIYNNLIDKALEQMDKEKDDYFINVIDSMLDLALKGSL